MKNVLLIITLLFISSVAMAAEDGTGQGKSSAHSSFAQCGYILDAEDGTGQNKAEDGTGQNKAEDGTGQGGLQAEDGTGQIAAQYWQCISQAQKF